MDLARAPRRAARKKGSGYENVEGQKINNMPNMASRKFSYIPKVICAA